MTFCIPIFQIGIIKDIHYQELPLSGKYMLYQLVVQIKQSSVHEYLDGKDASWFLRWHCMVAFLA